MCITQEELDKKDIKELLKHYKRAVELDSKADGNGQNPFDQNQLKEEILNRFASLERLVKTYSESQDGGMVGEP